jgi:hypothetical protein
MVLTNEQIKKFLEKGFDKELATDFERQGFIKHIAGAVHQQMEVVNKVGVKDFDLAGLMVVACAAKIVATAARLSEGEISKKRTFH